MVDAYGMYYRLIITLEVKLNVLFTPSLISVVVVVSPCEKSDDDDSL